MNKQEKGIVGIFDCPEKLKGAVEKVRALNVTRFDCFTPFPVHGLEKVMGLKRSWIPWATLVYGLLGGGLLFAFQAWTSAVDWPLNIGGKPFISWPAFIPVTFEGAILFGGVLTVITLFAVMKLPCYVHDVLDQKITTDHFALFVDAGDPVFDAARIQSALQESGAAEVKNI
ncbi:MAG: hypothetical protein A2048_05815 [Deltaproteobacteria bacterium GWA2_45_12]|nr:MAG: hypothetical protein A2048_05815 [Deltaproteobacteria bacterium GWA2_45_12]